MNSQKLSAVIITKNEEKNIARCLKSLQDLADEIIVIDAYSTDSTQEICREFGVRFYEKRWEGYSKAKNWGNSLASYSYILSIDADEEISKELFKSILEVKQQLNGVYSFNRALNYCGQWIKHCGWYPDVKIRIFPKNGSFWDNAEVHEKIEFLPTTHTHLVGNLHHFSYYTLSEHILRCNHYTNLSSERYVNKSFLSLGCKMLFSPAYRFFVSYFLKKGFLDGFNGLFICSMQSFDIFLKYQKAIQKKKQRTIFYEKNRTDKIIYYEVFD